LDEKKYFKYWDKKTNSRRNPYDVDLTIINNSGKKIDSIAYFLHRTFKYLILTQTNAINNFFLSLSVWGTFLIKVKKIFLKMGGALTFMETSILRSL